jgi:TolA-binding protein
MNKLKFLICLTFLLVLVSGLQAQETRYYTEIQKEIVLGKELFKNAKYNAAYRQFEKVREMADEKSEISSEAYYYMALSALRSEHVTGDKLLTNFIKDYADSPYCNYAKFYLGDFQFDKKRYALAVKTLGGVEREGLAESDRIKCGYMKGYCYMMTNELDLALNEFLLIKDKNHILAKPALYYWAHINYLKNDFDAALEGFRKLEKDPNFTKVIPMYVSNIYYKQGRYDEVINYTVPIINDVEESYKPELAKITGDSYFHLRRYSNAIQYLEYYHESKGTKSREDNYILGFSYYNTGNFAKAVPYLEKSSKGNDQLAQNSYYHLADAYIRTNQKEKARVAFEAASEINADAAIKEDALFNYAKLTYELSYSPFNETIKAFDKYITLYPNSERNTAAYQYLVEVFMVTKNYRDAISSIEKIKVRNAEINKAYQRVTYYRGLELFNNQSYELAIESFDKSLQNNFSSLITAGARLWRSEALYRAGDFNSAITGFNQFLNLPGATSLVEYSEAFYSLGYAYYKLEDYSSAGQAFRKYQSINEGKRNRKIADVNNRIGDTYFLARQYTDAINNYQKAFAMKIYDADYALYQMAFCNGLQKNQPVKIIQLNNLITSYPQSVYLDDALYELGRTYERENKYAEAKNQYQKILDKFGESTYYPKALLQMGLIHYNTGDYQNSLKYYKQVAENFNGTQEAQSALLGIKNCYVEMNNVDAYFTYANKMGNTTLVTTSEQDSLTYTAAEKQFMANNPNAAGQLQKYLQQYPNGSFVLNAHFYLAEALYNQGKYSESLEHYVYVSRQPVNAFSEAALEKASELLFNAKKYPDALEMYDRLENVSGNQWNKITAMAGKMRCSFILGKYRDAIDAAARLKKTEKTTEALLREAGYISGKSNYILGNYDLALTGIKDAAVETNTAQGAESKYLLADIYFKKQNLVSSEKEVMDFINKGTSYQFWLAKSFLLLSDIYEARNDDFQAKHTLTSLLDNYTNQTDGIVSEAKSKLAVIESREKKESEPLENNLMQINLNQK